MKETEVGAAQDADTENPLENEERGLSLLDPRRAKSPDDFYARLERYTVQGFGRTNERCQAVTQNPNDGWCDRCRGRMCGGRRVR